LKSNRTATATTTLSSVRSRHADIQQIESTILTLHALFNDLAQEVETQEPLITQAEQETAKVQTDVETGNKHLDKGIKSSRNRRKLKWWLLFVVVLIVVILALVLGLYFGLGKNK